MSVVLVQDVDSPVSEDSSVCSAFASIILQSAGTYSPCTSSTKSPFTISSTGTVMGEPLLITVTSGCDISFNFSRAWFALLSCNIPIMPLNTTITIIIMLSI